MIDITEVLAANHGVCRASELKRLGLYGQVPQALASGLVTRLREGVYALRGELDAVGTARALGGNLSCLTLLHAKGIWTPPSHAIHIRLPRERIRDKVFIAAHAPEAVLHRLTHFDSCHGAETPTTTLLCAQKCCNRDELVAILESMHAQGFALEHIHAATSSGMKNLRDAAALVEPGAESGLETLVRLRLRALGLRVRTQVSILNWRVDLLVGDWLVIEVDGFGFHRDREEFVRDRRKDRAITDLGFHVRRFSYDDVMFNWTKCEAEILRLVRAKIHVQRGRHVGR